MPMTFTDHMVKDHLQRSHLMTHGSMAECRERLAQHVETKHVDYMMAWEVRTGRPWNQMTRSEAEQLLSQHPALRFNPGLLSRLHSL